MRTLTYESTDGIFTMLQLAVPYSFDEVTVCPDTVDTSKSPPRETKVTIDPVRDATTQETDWLTETFLRLKKVAELSNNWDGRGSPGTEPGIVAAAVDLLNRIREDVRSDIPAAFVCPIAGGGLQFEWTSEQQHVELEFVDENTIVFLKEEKTGEQEEMDSGSYRLTNTDRTRQLLDCFAAG